MAGNGLVIGLHLDGQNEDQILFTVAGHVISINPVHQNKVYGVLAKAWVCGEETARSVLNPNEDMYGGIGCVLNKVESWLGIQHSRSIKKRPKTQACFATPLKGKEPTGSSISSNATGNWGRKSDDGLNVTQKAPCSHESVLVHWPEIRPLGFFVGFFCPVDNMSRGGYAFVFKLKVGWSSLLNWRMIEGDVTSLGMDFLCFYLGQCFSLKFSQEMSTITLKLVHQASQIPCWCF
ncbi:hypothetical protein SLEP1_g31270 [Rubroshorea leprosula]|uniref:Uncharacterized protein n=1 Tax=Rubroshorea leprosula TaxID=152421 RepID=A0AAV5KA67_9ROSI|nr:hypothetical protein SLEP1_g31270 [Rubroshorea leprosula]